MMKAYALASQHSYYNKYVLFLIYCKHFKIDVNSVSVENAIAFIKVLAPRVLSSSTIYIFVSAIHGFFRISNLLQANKSDYQPTRHLTRADACITPPRLSVFIK